jgi:hypothetical protein
MYISKLLIIHMVLIKELGMQYPNRLIAEGRPLESS